jgi:hypothetical protein
MKTLTTLLALALFCATGYGQTIKSLGYNTTNGEVVYTGTNVLTFTNAPAFTTNAVAQVRTNLGLGATWLTNTNADTFRTAIGLGATNTVTFDAVFASGFFEVGSGSNTVSIDQDGGILFGTANLAATTRTNLGLPLPALTNTSNADMLSALGAAQTIFTVKTNDQTIINETNATTITDLTFATEPGSRYVVTFLPIMEASVNNTALQVVASNATAYGNWNGLGAGSSGTVEATNEVNFGATTARSPLQVFHVEGGTNAGSISVTFRSTVATNTNTIKAGSFLRADKMP